MVLVDLSIADMFFGDLSIADFENRTGWHFSDSDRQWLLNHIQHNATNKEV